MALGAFLAVIGAAIGCSSENDADDGAGGNATLEGAACVDANDACCCESELEVAAPGGASTTCRYGFVGEPAEYTFELVTPEIIAALPQVESEAVCPELGWFVTPGEPGDPVQYAELCPATCSRLGAERGHIRALLGCPSEPC